MFDEIKFREICSEFYNSKSEFLSILLGKVTESFGNQGVIESVIPEEEPILLEIGYEKKNNQFIINNQYIKQMIQCQKEERRKYHISNQIHLKTVLLNQLKHEFKSKEEMVVVVDGEQTTPIKGLTKEEKDARFASFCTRCMKTESSKQLLTELLFFFKKQLQSSFVCEMLVNDAEFIHDGEDFIKEAFYVFNHVLSLTPRIETDDETPNQTDVLTSVQFKYRRWSLGSIIDDGVLKERIRVLKKLQLQGEYSKIEETSVKCFHQRVRKSWCNFSRVF